MSTQNMSLNGSTPSFSDRGQIYRDIGNGNPVKNQGTYSSASRDAMIIEHLPRVKYIAARIKSKLPAHVDMTDLVSAGALGLLDACEKYDPTRGVKFETYADLRIKGEILDSLRDADFLSKSERQKINKVNKAYKSLLNDGIQETEIYPRLAKRLGWDIPKLDSFLASHPLSSTCVDAGGVLSLDRMLEEDGENSIKSGYLGKYDSAVENVGRTQLKDILAGYIDDLPPKERLVVSLYYYDELLMREIGLVLGVSVSFISQIRSRAMKRLRQKVDPELRKFLQ